MRKVAWLGSIVALLLFPSFAAAAQHPKALSHAPAPFGSHSRAACGPQRGGAQCFALLLTNAAGATIVNALPSGYGPVDLQTAYNLAVLSAKSGSGETVAIVDAFDDPSAESDLAIYRSTYGLSPCTTANGCFKKVDQNGGTNYPAADAGWDGEISLDLDMVAAIAPNAHVLLVEATDNSFDNLAIAENEAASLRANAISNSYGAQEGSYATSFNAAYDHPGIAVTVSSGDSGWDNCGGSTCAGGPNFPASSQYVEAVGGTSLTSTKPRVEVAWAGAGSGCSTVFPKPTWQTDSGCANRTVADVSADADPRTGVAVYDSQPDIGGWAIFGGTSVSSPMLASFDALVGSAAASPSWAYSHNGWNDVATGSNGTCGTYICNAAPGYDGPTGVGTPNGTTLMSRALGKTAIGASSAALAANAKRVNAYQLSVAASVSKMDIYLAPSGATRATVMEGVIYANAGGSPGALLGQTRQISFSSTSAKGWYDLPFASSLTLSPGTYWLGIYTGGGGAASYWFDQGTTSRARLANNQTYVTGRASNPFGAIGWSDRYLMSLYAAYTTP